MKNLLIIALCFSLTLSLSWATANKKEDSSEECDDSNSSDDDSSSESNSSSGSSESVSSEEVLTSYFDSVDISRHEGESEEEYYKRIVAKYSDESEEEHEIRINFMKVILSKLSIWTNNKYKEYVSTATRSSSQVTASASSSQTSQTSTTSSSQGSSTTTTSSSSSASSSVTSSTTVSESYYEKQESETEETYYKRIFVKKSGESIRQYIKRLADLRKKKPNLEIWKENKFTDFVKSHVVKTSSSGTTKIVTRRKAEEVNVKYLKEIEKKSGETDEVYYNRIFKRQVDETVKSYKQRVKEMRKRLSNLQVWKNDEYKKYVSKYTAKTSTKSNTKTSTKAKREVTVNTKYLSEIEQRSGESKEVYYKRIFEKHSDETSKQYKKRIEEIKKRKPDLDCWKNHQYKKYTVVSRNKRSTVTVVNKYLKDIKQKSGESEEVYYQRIFMKHSDETNEQYRKRIDEIKKQFPNLKCWKDDKYKQYTSAYSSRVVLKYTKDIKKKESESEETYYKRIFQKHSDESKKQYRKRIEVMKKELPDLAVWKNNKYEEYTKVHTSSSTRASTQGKTSTSTSVNVVTKYMKDIKKKESETEEVYYQRIFKRHSDETNKQYKNRIVELKKQLPHLEVWKDDKYIQYTESYKSTVVTKYLTDIEKKESESDEVYYQRIFKKHNDESKKQYKNRVEEMKRRLSHLKVWQKNEYEKYTKVYVSSTSSSSTTKRSVSSSSSKSETITSSHKESSQQSGSATVVTRSKVDFTKKESETEEAYYERIFQKYSEESNEEYEKRVEVMKQEQPSLTVWKNEKYKEYMKKYKESSSGKVEKRSVDLKNVQIKHLDGIQRKSGESDEVYYKRILEKQSDETTEQYEERVNVMKQKLEHLSIWKTNEYKKYMSTSSSSSSSSSYSSSSSSSSKSSTTLKYTENININEGESEETYYKRILKKHSDESSEEYSQRLQYMMQKLSHLSIWKNNEYVKYQETKEYSTSGSSVNKVEFTEVVKESGKHSEQHSSQSKQVSQKQEKC